MALQTTTTSPARLRGLVTEADLPSAECEWPGLQAFLTSLPASDRPGTFLELVWRFEAHRQGTRH